MSASIDQQRAKGQSHQAPNGQPKDTEFDAYLQGQPPQQQGYNSATMGSPNVSDPYMTNYYAPYMSFPNMNQGAIGEGAWSNGDPMSYVGGYGQMNNDYMSSNGMFSFDYTQAGFGWGFHGGDYSAWGTTPGSTQGRKPDDRSYMNSYYGGMGGAEEYGNMNGEMERDAAVKSVEQGLKGVNISDKQEAAQAKDVSQHGQSSSGTVSNSAQPSGSQAPKKMTWASIASQPARPQPPKLQPKSIPRAPVLPGKHGNMDIGTWEGKNGAKQGGQQSRQAWNAPRGRSGGSGSYGSGPSGGGSSPNGGSASNAAAQAAAIAAANNPVLDKLRSANQYNPKDFNLNPKGARFFVIKSYSEDDIHRSIKYSIWCSTEHGNKRLDSAYKEREGKGGVYLFFSVNGSGHFCGMAQMMSPLDYGSSSSVWAQDKWKGQFEVKWIYVKDVPNSQLRHIRLENNENKPVTNSRDTQEVPPEKGRQMLRVIHQYRHNTSIFDDFIHYEKRQEEEDDKKPEDEEQEPQPQQQAAPPQQREQGQNQRASRHN